MSWYAGSQNTAEVTGPPLSAVGRPKPRRISSRLCSRLPWVTTTPRLRGAAGGILQEGRVVARAGHERCHGFVVELVDGQPRKILHGGRLAFELKQSEGVGSGEGQLGRAVFDDGVEPRRSAAWLGIGGRGGQHAGVQAAEKGGDEIQSRRKDQHGAVAGGGMFA